MDRVQTTDTINNNDQSSSKTAEPLTLSITVPGILPIVLTSANGMNPIGLRPRIYEKISFGKPGRVKRSNVTIVPRLSVRK